MQPSLRSFLQSPVARGKNSPLEPPKKSLKAQLVNRTHAPRPKIAVVPSSQRRNPIALVAGGGLRATTAVAAPASYLFIGIYRCNLSRVIGPLREFVNSEARSEYVTIYQFTYAFQYNCGAGPHKQTLRPLCRVNKRVYPGGTIHVRAKAREIIARYPLSTRIGCCYT